MPQASAEVVAALRLKLLDTLRAISTAAPSDSVALGQLARFAIDANRIDLALPLVEGCAAERTFCQELQALLAYYQRDWSKAESLFTIARHERGASCDSDLTLLLEEFESITELCKADSPMPAQQDRFWWFADPLWSTEVNERRLEHERRRLDHALRTMIGRDEFLDYTADEYVRASRALLVRYGQPTAFRARADLFERARSQGATPDRLRPIGAFNYSLDRSATIPGKVVRESPFTSAPRDWLTDEYRSDRFQNPWPREHARFPFRLFTSDAMQVARFRRDSSLLLLAAVAAPPTWKSGRQQRPEKSYGVWMSSPGERVTAAGESDGARMRTPCRDGVLSYEVEDDDSRRWRAREGVPSLRCDDSALAVSDVLITDGRPPAGESAETIALSRVRSTLRFPRDSAKLGLYFELYGSRASDSLVVTLSFRAREQGGAWSWLTNALIPMGGGRVRDSGIQWSVPPQRAEAARPRSVATDLDMRSAPIGSYDITMTVESAGSRAQSAVRTIVIAR